jgi:hypothetical protein
VRLRAAPPKAVAAPSRVSVSERVVESGRGPAHRAGWENFPPRGHLPSSLSRLPKRYRRVFAWRGMRRCGTNWRWRSAPWASRQAERRAQVVSALQSNAFAKAAAAQHTHLRSTVVRRAPRAAVSCQSAEASGQFGSWPAVAAAAAVAAARDGAAILVGALFIDATQRIWLNRSELRILHHPKSPIRLPLRAFAFSEAAHIRESRTPRRRTAAVLTRRRSTDVNREPSAVGVLT